MLSDFNMILFCVLLFRAPEKKTHRKKERKRRNKINVRGSFEFCSLVLSFRLSGLNANDGIKTFFSQ